MLDIANAPSPVSRELLRALDEAWGRNSHERRAKSSEEAIQRIDEIIGYNLRMFWQGRHDKYGREMRQVLAWLTENALPSEMTSKERDSLSSKAGFGKTMFLDYDHDYLAKQVTDQIIAVYKDIPDLDFPESAELPKGFFARLFGR